MRASDIHLEPMEKRYRVRYRIDGALREVDGPPKYLQANFTSRVKIMAHLDRLVPHIGVYFVMQSLKYARKGGRIGAIKAVGADALGVKPEECVMVGNGAGEDMVAEKCGMRVFLLTDCLLNRKGTDISACPQGGFSELIAFLEAFYKSFNGLWLIACRFIFRM